jgi:cardiolipin synthase
MIRDLRSTPNQLTLLRLLFIPFLTIAIIEQRYVTALIIFIIAGISDGLDGLLARWLKQRTTLGQYLDPIADKLLLSSMFVVLSLTHLIPWRITILVFSRDLGILLVAAVLYMTTSLRDFSPSIIGKANTVAQIITVLLVLMDEVWDEPWMHAAKNLGFWAVMALTVASAVHYIVLTGKRLHLHGAGD